MACQSRTSPEVTFAAGCIELFLLVTVPSHRVWVDCLAHVSPLGGTPSGAIRRVMDSPCLSAAGVRFLSHPVPAVDLARSCDGVTGWLQTTTGLPRSAEARCVGRVGLSTPGAGHRLSK